MNKKLDNILMSKTSAIIIIILFITSLALFAKIALSEQEVKISYEDYQQCVQDRDYILYSLNQCNAELEACYRIGE